mmetsp:Transcript_27082/g.108412  ORF Transcript_27082/g.108412 Transcript_27082/m.108412 type:complete len:563 (+) Transcript_27082:1400-3088(+)
MMMICTREKDKDDPQHNPPQVVARAVGRRQGGRRAHLRDAVPVAARGPLVGVALVARVYRVGLCGDGVLLQSDAVGLLRRRHGGEAAVCRARAASPRSADGVVRRDADGPPGVAVLVRYRADRHRAHAEGGHRVHLGRMGRHWTHHPRHLISRHARAVPGARLRRLLPPPDLLPPLLGRPPAPRRRVAVAAVAPRQRGRRRVAVDPRLWRRGPLRRQVPRRRRRQHARLAVLDDGAALDRPAPRRVRRDRRDGDGARRRALSPAARPLARLHGHALGVGLPPDDDLHVPHHLVHRGRSGHHLGRARHRDRPVRVWGRRRRQHHHECWWVRGASEEQDARRQSVLRVADARRRRVRRGLPPLPARAAARARPALVPRAAGQAVRRLRAVGRRQELAHRRALAAHAARGGRRPRRRRAALAARPAHGAATRGGGHRARPRPVLGPAPRLRRPVRPLVGRRGPRRAATRLGAHRRRRRLVAVRRRAQPRHARRGRRRELLGRRAPAARARARAAPAAQGAHPRRSHLLPRRRDRRGDPAHAALAPAAARHDRPVRRAPPPHDHRL